MLEVVAAQVGRNTGGTVRLLFVFVSAIFIFLSYLVPVSAQGNPVAELKKTFENGVDHFSTYKNGLILSVNTSGVLEYSWDYGNTWLAPIENLVAMSADPFRPGRIALLKWLSSTKNYTLILSSTEGKFMDPVELPPSFSGPAKDEFLVFHPTDENRILLYVLDDGKDDAKYKASREAHYSSECFGKGGDCSKFNATSFSNGDGSQSHFKVSSEKQRGLGFLLYFSSDAGKTWKRHLSGKTVQSCVFCKEMLFSDTSQYDTKNPDCVLCATAYSKNINSLDETDSLMLKPRTKLLVSGPSSTTKLFADAQNAHLGPEGEFLGPSNVLFLEISIIGSTDFPQRVYPDPILGVLADAGFVHIYTISSQDSISVKSTSSSLDNFIEIFYISSIDFPNTPRFLFLPSQRGRAIWTVNLNLNESVDVYLTVAENLETTKILENVATDDFGKPSLYRIAEANGLLIANVVGEKSQTPPNFGNPANIYVQTYISLNDGGHWQRPCLKADKKTCINFNIATPHLESVISGSKYVPGLLIGSACTDNGTSVSSCQLETYLSRDNGVLWTKIDGKQNMAFFPDYSGTVSMIDSSFSTLRYTANFFASSLEKINITDNFTSLVNAFTNKPGELGVLAKFKNSLLYFNVNMTGIYPLCDKKSLTEITPITYCIFGQRASYAFRNDSDLCLLPEAINITYSKCLCENADFDCKEGFYHYQNAEICTQKSGSISQPENCPLGTQFDIPSGYRKISLSRCMNDENFTSPITKDCQPQQAAPLYAFTSIAGKSGSIVDLFTLDEQRTFVFTSEKNVYTSENSVAGWSLLESKYEDYAFNADRGEMVVLTSDAVFFWLRDRPKLNQISLEKSEGESKSSKIDLHNIFAGSILRTSLLCKENCFYETKYTKNFGIEWKPVPGNYSSCLWLQTRQFSSVGSMSIVCNDEKDVFFSDNFFLSVRKLASNVEYIQVVNKHLVVIQTSEDGKSGSLLLATNNLDLSDVTLPYNFNQLNFKNANVFAFHDESLFVSVDQNLFKLVDGTKSFNFVAERLNSAPDGTLELASPKSIPGVLIANFFRFEASADAKLKVNFTSVSRDNGKTWGSLSPPEKYWDGSTNGCIGKKDSCFTHLHFVAMGSSRQKYSSFGRHDTPGMLYGAGNSADRLSKSRNDTFIYVSRDAGVTWREVAELGSGFEIAAYGSILATIREPNLFSYSTDGGDTFTTQRFSKQSFVHLKFKPNSVQDNATFVFYGKEAASSSSWHVFKAVFANPRAQKCEIDISLSQTDLELIPELEKCHLGTKIEAFRKKDGSSCVLNQLPQSVVINGCDCELGDYECDYAFTSMPSGECKPLKNIELICDGQVREISTGYRKSPLSACEGGVRYTENISSVCKSPTSVLLIVFLVLLGSGILFFIANVYVRRRTGQSITSRVVDAYYRIRYASAYQPRQQQGTSLFDDDIDG